jgi:hypothetical protein
MTGGDGSELIGLFRHIIKHKRFLDVCEYHDFDKEEFREELLERGYHIKH